MHRVTKIAEPLSAADLLSTPNDGSQVRVAYQVYQLVVLILFIDFLGFLIKNMLLYHPTKGLPGAYSEAAALKVYPKCETVPCDNFEAAFKVQTSSKLSDFFFIKYAEQ